MTNELPALSSGPGDSGLEGTVTEMAIHAAAILLCGQNEALGPLRNLAFRPADMAVSHDAGLGACRRGDLLNPRVLGLPLCHLVR